MEMYKKAGGLRHRYAEKEPSRRAMGVEPKVCLNFSCMIPPVSEYAFAPFGLYGSRSGTSCRHEGYFAVSTDAA